MCKVLKLKNNLIFNVFVTTLCVVFSAGNAFAMDIVAYDAEITAMIHKAEQIALDTYQKINANWTYPDRRKIMTASRSWEIRMVKTTQGPTPALIWLRKNQPNLLQAIDESINTQGLQQECCNAAKLTRIKIIYTLLGEDLAKDWIEQTWRQSGGSDFQFLNQLSWSFYKRVSDTSAPGIYAYPFVNIAEYNTYKDGGADGNHNIVKLSDGSLIGFEPSFFNVPRSEQELEKLLFDRFTEKKDLALGCESKHDQACKNLTFATFVAQRTIGQDQIGVYQIDFDGLLKYKKSSCAQCGNADKDKQVCAGCHKVRYCGRACQVEHWKSGHRTNCNKKVS